MNQKHVLEIKKLSSYLFKILKNAEKNSSLEQLRFSWGNLQKPNLLQKQKLKLMFLLTMDTNWKAHGESVQWVLKVNF